MLPACSRLERMLKTPGASMKLRKMIPPTQVPRPNIWRNRRMLVMRGDYHRAGRKETLRHERWRRELSKRVVLRKFGKIVYRRDAEDAEMARRQLSSTRRASRRQLVEHMPAKRG